MQPPVNNRVSGSAPAMVIVPDQKASSGPSTETSSSNSKATASASWTISHVIDSGSGCAGEHSSVSASKTPLAARKPSW